MAPAAAACPSLHELEGSCEYCGEPCDSTQDELNAINCTFEGCPSPEIYHQSCIEAYLKSIRLDKQRKTGFQCPRGCGKGSKWDKPCPGRVTKSHPIHARNDCSKKRRKAKMPEPAPQPVISSTTKKQAVVSKSKALKSEKEKSPEMEESTATATPAKAQVLNRASSLPPIDKSPATGSIAGEILADSAAGGMQKSKVGSPNGHISTACDSEKCSDSGSADNSDSEGSVSSQQSSAPSRDFKEALAGPKLSVTLPVANAWTSGRPRNGDILSPEGKEQIPAVPLEIRPSPTQPATRPENCSASLQQPQLSQPSIQPVSADLASLEAEELELEERRKRAKTKNEKKHVQRAAARLREKREALLAAASAATKHAGGENRSITPSSESVGGKAVVTNRVDAHGHVTVRPWSQSCLKAIMERKSTLVVHQLENLGFAPWQSILSVRVNGVDLEHCLEWLLRNGSKIHASMPCGPDQPMDIRTELKKLDELRKSKDFTQDQIESSVISRAGDVDAAVAHLRSGGRGEVRAVSTHNPTTQAQTPILASRGGSTFGASTGSHASSWDGQLLTSPRNSITWPSHSRGLDFQNPNQFAGGECISDISRYNARVQSENGYVSPKAVLSGSTNGRQGFARETAKSSPSPVHVLNNDMIRPADPYSHNLTHVESLPSTFSRQSSLQLESYGRSSNDVGIGRSFAPQVNADMSLSRSMSGSGYFQSQSEHPPLENGCHGTSLFSEPTVSTVTSVTAAVLNDGRIDEQAIARLTESMDSTECSGLNTSHLHRIWGTQGLAVGSSSSFYSSDIAPRINSSSAALSQVFSAGISARAECPSFGVSGRNSYPGGNWASNPISKSALTESIRSLGLSSAYGGAVSEVTSANRLMSPDYSYGETGGWSESSATTESHHRNGYFYSTAGLYEQPQMPFSDQQQPQHKGGLNGHSHTLAGRNDYSIASPGSQLKTADIGNGDPPSIWLQQSPAARPPIDETGNDSLVSHLVEMLKV